MKWMITRQVLPLSLQCLDGNNFLQKRATRAAGHMFMWQLRLHNLKGHMIFFFFPVSFKLTACCLQTTNNNESSKAFSSICFHTHYFSFPLLWLWLYSSQAVLALPEEPPASTGGACCPHMCHWGCPTTGIVSLGSSNWDQAILSA